MKIGILTSDTDNLTLFKILHKYNHNYYIFLDSKFSFRWDKSIDLITKRIKEIIITTKKLWIDKIILPPTLELYFLYKKEYSDYILPIFFSYLNYYCLNYSLIWKIWFFWDNLDIKNIDIFFKNIKENYKLNENQKNIKQFKNNFPIRKKNTNILKYFLTNFSYSNYMVNKTLKFNLKYFKDSNIDTLIPLNYWYFNFQKTITKYFNQKKTRFHKIEKINIIFQKLWLKESEYKVFLKYNDNINSIESNKKLLYILKKWKTINIDIEKMEF